MQAASISTRCLAFLNRGEIPDESLRSLVSKCKVLKKQVDWNSLADSAARVGALLEEMIADLEVDNAPAEGPKVNYYVRTVREGSYCQRVFDPFKPADSMCVLDTI